MPMGAVWAFAAGNAGAEVGEAGGGRILGPGRRPRQHLGLLQHPFQCQDEHASRELLRVKLGERPASKSQRFLPRRDRATGTPGAALRGGAAVGYAATRADTLQRSTAWCRGHPKARPHPALRSSGSSRAPWHDEAARPDETLLASGRAQPGVQLYVALGETHGPQRKPRARPRHRPAVGGSSSRACCRHARRQRWGGPPRTPHRAAPQGRPPRSTVPCRTVP